MSGKQISAELRFMMALISVLILMLWRLLDRTAGPCRGEVEGAGLADG